jgi:tetratricopeptide (TPR) repeat protein
LSASSQKSPVIVEDVVASLTGEVGPGPGERTALRDRMQRATEEFDARTAEAFARALLESLTQNPTDLRQLEALVILGVSHPEVLETHRISLEKEADRLMFLLERAGENERAETLRELLDGRVHAPSAPQATPAGKGAASEPHTDLVERYLRQADEATLAGRRREAIACLQEVLALEPGRREVARMLRDLRGRKRRRSWNLLGPLKLVAVLGLLGALGYGVWQRELHVRSKFALLPHASDDDAAALDARMAAIDDLIREEYAWFGMGDALIEKRRIEALVRRLGDRASTVRHETTVDSKERLQNAEAARQRALMYAQQGNFDQAVSDLKLALEYAPKGWEHEHRVAADLAAIEAFRSRPRDVQGDDR